VAALNLGGVGNITLVGQDGDLTAFDTGPANGMIDLWVQARTDRRYDHHGALAAAGRVDEGALQTYLAHAYFAAPGPKSLDRYDFDFQPVKHLSLEDGAATLTAFAAQAVALALRACPQKPHSLIVSGGGRHNPVLLDAIRVCAGAKVINADDLDWRGDAIEAEAFAYLAARTVKGLPISFPGTTGVPVAMCGGRVVMP
jgi:anhydro-N-acetylmuramic acid kinase